MIVRPAAKLIQELEASSFTIIGNPGSDGLGVEAMRVYSAAIAQAEGDIIVTLGDIVPVGKDKFYDKVARIIEHSSPKPMYVLRGNHDGGEYPRYFGIENRAVLAEDFVLIMLDNSERRFTDEALSFLRETLAMVESRNVVVAFHVPPPNRICGDSLSVEEWERFEEAAGVWRKRISVLVASHSHSYFEDEINGLRLIVTGGGGSRITDLERVAVPSHHIIEFRIDADGGMVCRQRELSSGGGDKREPGTRKILEAAYSSECRSHVRHLVYADDAERLGLHNLARLFRASAEARLRHAGNLHRVLAKEHNALDAVTESLGAPGAGPMEIGGDLTDRPGDPLVAGVLSEMASSRAVYADFFAAALTELSGGGDIAQTRYHVCASCGHIFSGYDAPPHCRECGAPEAFIRETY